MYSFKTRSEDSADIFSYGFAQTSGELDDALTRLGEVFQDMLELAQVEKTMQMLAQEIEKTRRRGKRPGVCDDTGRCRRTSNTSP